MTDINNRTCPNPQEFPRPTHNPAPAVVLTGITAPPQVIKIEDCCVTIRGLPKLPQDTMRESGVGRIAHRIKKLFFNGDRLGSAAFTQKLLRDEDLENATFRINLVYTFKWCDNDDLEVHFLRNLAHTPHWLDAQHKPANPMSNDEANYFMGLGISLFVSEVTNYFQSVQYEHLKLHGKHLQKFPTPDYVTPAPALLPLRTFGFPTVLS